MERCNTDHGQMQADVETCEAFLQHASTCIECKGDKRCRVWEAMARDVDEAIVRSDRGWRKDTERGKRHASQNR